MRDVEVDGITQRVRVFTKAELIECSAVAIPANRSSLARAASAMLGVNAGTGDADDALDARIENAVQRAFERVLKDELEAGPGGLLCSVLSQAADTMHGHAGLGDAYLGGNPGTPAPGNHDPASDDDFDITDDLDGEGDNHELKALALDAIGAAGDN
jgi:hypothetical protein